jgi:MHS family proline/betaine transporter-like MFS transporter
MQSDVDGTSRLKGRLSAVVATVVGNALEWFDFAAYAFLASIVAKHFFPDGNPVAMLMSAFAAFGVGFVARPMGAVIFGRMGDRSGRKLALLISMPLMGVGTLLVGATPSYATIGIAAPILLVLGRMMQGFAAGGEVGNAMAFLSEWAPANRRAFYSSLQQCSSLFGTLAGSGCAALLTGLMSPDDLASWGWRIPFLLGGLLIAPLGMFLRRHVDETPVFEHKPVSVSHESRSGPHWVVGLQAIGLSMAWVATFYVYLIYLPTFLTNYAGLSSATALWANTAGLAAMTVTIPLAGLLSDIVGRKPPIILGCVTALLICYPVFDYLRSGASVPVTFMMMIGFGILAGLFAGVIPAIMTELFPTAVRTTGVSVSFGLSTAIFGGFAPFIITGLIALMDSPLAPIAYLLPTALVSLVVAFRLRETAHETLS